MDNITSFHWFNLGRVISEERQEEMTTNDKRKDYRKGEDKHTLNQEKAMTNHSWQDNCLVNTRYCRLYCMNLVIRMAYDIWGWLGPKRFLTFVLAEEKTPN